ncbi:MAG TPA: helix-turn-helix domain-containing protein [Anaerolineaceae bacterium]|nr:helix-turn-helix domain-containing protein [Anaerolineaceae bacterium]
MSGKKGMIHFHKETKLLAVQMCLEQGKTHAETAQELGLPRGELVEQWVRRFRREGEAGFDKPIGRPRKTAFTQATYIARLEMENALLKKFHTELRTAILARRNIGSSNITEDSTL